MANRRSFNLITLALVALAFLALTVRATPSVSPNDEEFAAALFPRAGSSAGAYVGSSCTKNSDCFSKYCVATSTSSTKKTCQRQPVGGPCTQNANCATRNCNPSTKKCRKPSNALGVCKSTGDCYFYARDYELSCDTTTSTCRNNDGGICSSNAECTSNICLNGRCNQPPQRSGKNCNYYTECKSGKCIQRDGKEPPCLAPDGSYFNCGYFPGGYDLSFTGTCARNPLGGKCEDPGECQVGVCRNGICSKSRVGDDCKTNIQCTDGQVCGYDAFNSPFAGCKLP
ncbi:hypothetical protein V8E36_002264 [Tilletia maclaganii]